MKSEIVLRVAPAVAAFLLTVAPYARAASTDAAGPSSPVEAVTTPPASDMAGWLSKATRMPCETSGAVDCNVVLAKNPFKHFGHSQKESFQRGKEKIKKAWNKVRGKKTPASNVGHNKPLPPLPHQKPLPTTPGSGRKAMEAKTGAGQFGEGRPHPGRRHSVHGAAKPPTHKNAGTQTD